MLEVVSYELSKAHRRSDGVMACTNFSHDCFVQRSVGILDCNRERIVNDFRHFNTQKIPFK